MQLLMIFLTILTTSLWVIINSKRKNIRDYGSVIFAIATFIQVVLYFFNTLQKGINPHYEFLWMGDIPVIFSPDYLSFIFAFLASFLWIITSIYAIGYMRGHHERNQTRFFAFFPIAIFSAVGIAFSGNLITLFLFYEIMTFSTWPLVAHHGTQKAQRGAGTYLKILVFFSMLLFLPAMIVISILNGGAPFSENGIIPIAISSHIIGLLLFMLCLGTAKAALFPTHGWLPAAMVAPTPVSALLHAVAVVKAGVFTIIRITSFTFGNDKLSSIGYYADWLAYLAIFSLLFASLVAMRQNNIKRRLAFSTVSQLSYITLAAAMFTSLGTQAAAIHIVGHALGKILLFFGAGSILVASHKTKVEQLDGIGRLMPVTMAAMSIGVISVIGLPPTIGFVSKFYVMQATFAAQHYIGFFALIISTILNCIYLLPFIFRAWFKPLAKDSHKHGEAPIQNRIAMTIVAMLTIALFLFPSPLMGFVGKVIGG